MAAILPLLEGAFRQMSTRSKMIFTNWLRLRVQTVASFDSLSVEGKRAEVVRFYKMIVLKDLEHDLSVEPGLSHVREEMFPNYQADPNIRTIVLKPCDTFLEEILPFTTGFDEEIKMGEEDKVPVNYDQWKSDYIHGKECIVTTDAQNSHMFKDSRAYTRNASGTIIPTSFSYFYQIGAECDAGSSITPQTIQHLYTQAPVPTILPNPPLGEQDYPDLFPSLTYHIEQSTAQHCGNHQRTPFRVVIRNTPPQQAPQDQFSVCVKTVALKYIQDALRLRTTRTKKTVNDTEFVITQPNGYRLHDQPDEIIQGKRYLPVALLKTLGDHSIFYSLLKHIDTNEALRQNHLHVYTLDRFMLLSNLSYVVYTQLMYYFSGQAQPGPQEIPMIRSYNMVTFLTRSTAQGKSAPMLAFYASDSIKVISDEKLYHILTMVYSLLGNHPIDTHPMLQIYEQLYADLSERLRLAFVPPARQEVDTHLQFILEDLDTCLLRWIDGHREHLKQSLRLLPAIAGGQLPQEISYNILSQLVSFASMIPNPLQIPPQANQGQGIMVTNHPSAAHQVLIRYYPNESEQCWNAYKAYIDNDLEQHLRYELGSYAGIISYARLAFKKSDVNVADFSIWKTVFDAVSVMLTRWKYTNQPVPVTNTDILKYLLLIPTSTTPTGGMGCITTTLANGNNPNALYIASDESRFGLGRREQAIGSPEMTPTGTPLIQGPTVNAIIQQMTGEATMRSAITRLTQNTFLTYAQRFMGNATVLKAHLTTPVTYENLYSKLITPFAGGSRFGNSGLHPSRPQYTIECVIPRPMDLQIADNIKLKHDRFPDINTCLLNMLIFVYYFDDEELFSYNQDVYDSYNTHAYNMACLIDLLYALSNEDNNNEDVIHPTIKNLFTNEVVELEELVSICQQYGRYLVTQHADISSTLFARYEEELVNRFFTRNFDREHIIRNFPNIIEYFHSQLPPAGAVVPVVEVPVVANNMHADEQHQKKRSSRNFFNRTGKRSKWVPIDDGLPVVAALPAVAAVAVHGGGNRKRRWKTIRRKSQPKKRITMKKSNPRKRAGKYKMTKKRRAH